MQGLQQIAPRRPGGSGSAAPGAVLHVSRPGSEGVANFVRDLSVQQSAKGERVAIAGPPDSPLASDAADLGIELLPWSAARWPGPGSARELRQLTEIIERFEPDVVHLHSAKAGVIGRLLLRGRRPTVFQPHAWSFEAAGWPVGQLATSWERSAGPWADAIVMVSEGERLTAIEQGIAASLMNVTVPNPVDTRIFRPWTAGDGDGIRRSLGLGDEPIVACFGRLCRQKGQDLLLDAWPLVLGELPNARLLLVGDGPSRPTLEARAIANVHMLGNRGDVAELMRAVQVVALPSRWEGMSLAMLEAMASATPVVANNVGGVSETVGAGAGSVVAVGDGPAMAAALLRRLTDPALAASEGLRGRTIVDQSHTMATVVDALDEVYRSVMAVHQSGPAPHSSPASFGSARPVDD